MTNDWRDWKPKSNEKVDDEKLIGNKFIYFSPHPPCLNLGGRRTLTAQAVGDRQHHVGPAQVPRPAPLPSDARLLQPALLRRVPRAPAPAARQRHDPARAAQGGARRAPRRSQPGRRGRRAAPAPPATRLGVTAHFVLEAAASTEIYTLSLADDLPISNKKE